MDPALVVRTILALAVVSATLTLLAIVLRRVGERRFFGSQRGRALALIESTGLGGGAALHLVRVVDRYYAIATNAAHVATVCEVAASGVDGLSARGPSAAASTGAGRP